MSSIERKCYPVTLPSKGKFYNNLTTDGEVLLQPIRVFEEKMLASGIGSPTDRINRMISSCLKTPLPISDLLLVDRFFLMFQLASLSYGSDRTINVKCPSCKESIEKKLDLSKDFDIHYLDDDVEEPIVIDLPISKNKVSLKFLRVKDEAQTMATVEKLKKPKPSGNQGQQKALRPSTGLSKEDIYTVRLVSSVTLIDGKEQTLEEKVEWANNLEGQDSDALRTAFDAYDFGVDPTFHITCTNCQESFQSILPPDDFFRL